MLWIKLETGTYNIVGYNIHQNPQNQDIYEFWVTKITGKSVKIIEGTYLEIHNIRFAMDEALENGKFIIDLT